MGGLKELEMNSMIIVSGMPKGWNWMWQTRCVEHKRIMGKITELVLEMKKNTSRFEFFGVFLSKPGPLYFCFPFFIMYCWRVSRIHSGTVMWPRGICFHDHVCTRELGSVVQATFLCVWLLFLFCNSQNYLKRTISICNSVSKYKANSFFLMIYRHTFSQFRFILCLQGFHGITSEVHGSCWQP